MTYECEMFRRFTLPEEVSCLRGGLLKADWLPVFHRPMKFLSTWNVTTTKTLTLKNSVKLTQPQINRKNGKFLTFFQLNKVVNLIPQFSPDHQPVQQMSEVAAVRQLLLLLVPEVPGLLDKEKRRLEVDQRPR